MTLRQTIFRSRALVQEYSSEALDILRVSIRNNQERGITGCLHQQDGLFFCCVEGEAVAIGELLTKIARDPRHTDMTILGDIETSSRRFPEWSMSYTSNHGIDMHDLLGSPSAELENLEAGHVLEFLGRIDRVKSDGMHRSPGP